MWPTSWWVARVAIAAPPCEPVDEAAFRSYVLDVQSAIDRGDIELPTAILSELEPRLPCLTFAPQPRMWADLMVARAIVQFSRGEPWEDSMAAALRIRPAIDRGVGSGHPLADWQPPPAAPGGAPVPEGAQLYVDGLPSPTLPPDEGVYLVQKTDGVYWNTLLVQDATLPPDWVVAEVERPPRISAWGRVGGVLGFGTVGQDSDWDSDWYVDRQDGQAVIGVAGDLQVTFFSPFGLLAQGQWAARAQSPGLDARAAAIWTYDGLTIGGGIGTSSVDIFEQVSQDEVLHQFQMLRYGHGTVLLRALHGGLRWDAGATVGGSAAVTRADLGLGLSAPLGGERFRVGLGLTVAEGRFVPEGQPGRELMASSSRALLRVDWVRGEY